MSRKLLVLAAVFLVLGVVVHANKLNDTLEARAKKIVTAMKGYYIYKGTTYKECYVSKACQFNGVKHSGLLIFGSYATCMGLKPDTVCVSKGAIKDGRRGYVFIHEAHHLYMYRLWQRNLLAQYFPGVDMFNEKLTDCLALLGGAPSWTLNYGCSTTSSTYKLAKKIRAKWSPYNTTWAFPPPSPTTPTVVPSPSA